MSIEEKESRRYSISGEATPQDWDRVSALLGELGIGMRHIKPPVEKRMERKNPSELPYDLADIKSRGQYVSIEHLFEFWPEYYNGQHGRKSIYNRRRAVALEAAFEAVIRFRPRWANKRVNRHLDTTQLREEAGIKVASREEIGFPPYERNRAGCDRDRMAVQAGGFIDFMEGYESLPDEQRLSGLYVPGVVFLSELAKNLSSQIHQPQE